MARSFFNPARFFGLNMDTTFPEFYNINFLKFFRTVVENKKKTGTDTLIQAKTQIKETTPIERSLICKRCGYKITTRSASITVGNAHQHTFANPAGLLFEIGCFQSAPGCLNTGPFTDEFSWFKGYKWRISICGSCLTHVGWMFGSATHLFFGLILDRLTDSPATANFH